MRNRVIILLLILLVIGVGCTSKSPQKESSPELLVDATAPEIVKTLFEYHGEKPVLLNVWATWCVPCVEEFPYLMKLNEEYGDQFELVLISGDFESERPDAYNFLKKQKVDFTTYFKQGGDNEFISTLSENWTGALPYTMVFDRQGNVSEEWEGAADYETFEQALLKVINQTES